jgi:hypothetical protein
MTALATLVRDYTALHKAAHAYLHATSDRTARIAAEKLRAELAKPSQAAA